MNIEAIENAENFAKNVLKLSPEAQDEYFKMLEEAMADMQRAFNSKRAIAEIALTRMCDAKLSVSYEALAARVEELERSLKMITLGVTPVSSVNKEENKSNIIEKITEENNQQKTIKTVDKPKALASYSDWGSVIRKISEVKVSLSASIAGAAVFTDGSGYFVLRMGDFFAKKLSSNETDLAIVRGIIAESEGKSPAEIKISIESNANNANSSQDDLENLFK